MTTLPPLVGLIGKKRVGKDTFAAVLVEEFGFARVAFADPLKEMALTIDPIIANGLRGSVPVHMRLSTAVALDGWESVKDTYPEVRRFLQRLGDGVRQFDEDFWVGAGMKAAAGKRIQRPDFHNELGRGEGHWLPGQPVVITDVRYPNEADAIRDAGGILVRIVRPGVDDGDTHASETALDDYAVDDIVENRGSVFELEMLARDRGAWIGTLA